MLNFAGRRFMKCTFFCTLKQQKQQQQQQKENQKKCLRLKIVLILSKSSLDTLVFAFSS